MMTYHDQNALKLCHRYWQERIRPGMTCVDATAGRGRDTALLCRLTGERGTVLAFDIQREAVEETSVPGCEAGGAVKTAISEPKRTTAAAADASSFANPGAQVKAAGDYNINETDANGKVIASKGRLSISSGDDDE